MVSVEFKYFLINLYRYFRYFWRLIFVGLFCIFTPVNKNKIVFCSFQGQGLGGNTKYIAKEILKQNLPYELVWLLDEKYPKDGDLKGIRFVNYNDNFSKIKELASAKIWIDNSLKTEEFRLGLLKKRNQFYINTWHGSLGIKKLFYDTINYNPGDSFIYFLKKDFKNCNLMISNCEWEENVYRSAIRYHGPIDRSGHAGNDIFFENRDKYKDKVFEILKIKKDKKIALYAPTYRNALGEKSYDIDYKKLKKSLEEKFGPDWVILSRLHTFNLKNSCDFVFKDSLDVSFYPDCQELLSAADVLISDYSSCMFDFMVTKRPCFIYAVDIEEYIKERGFYYSIYDTPFPIAKNNDELTENILNFDCEKYEKKCEDFYNSKKVTDDGKSAERIVKKISEIMKNEI